MAKRAIWKIQVPIDGTAHHHELPLGAQAIFVGVGPTVAPDHIGVWVAVEPEQQEKTQMYLRVFATGEHFDDEVFDSYVGSVVCGIFVWHVLAMTKDEEA